MLQLISFYPCPVPEASLCRPVETRIRCILETLGELSSLVSQQCLPRVGAVGLTHGSSCKLSYQQAQTVLKWTWAVVFQAKWCPEPASAEVLFSI